MSAPHTDLEKQKKRHKGPLFGMGAMVAFGVIIIVVLGVIYLFAGNDPGSDEVIDGRTGTVTETQ